jgi:hypothetical protein
MEPDGSIPHSQEPFAESLSWATSIHSIPFQPVSLRSISLLSTHTSSWSSYSPLSLWLSQAKCYAHSSKSKSMSGCQAQSGIFVRRSFFFPQSYCLVFLGASSLMRGRVCHVLIHHLLHSCYVPSQSHPPLLDHPILGEEYNLWSYSLCAYSSLHGGISLKVAARFTVNGASLVWQYRECKIQELTWVLEAPEQWVLNEMEPRYWKGRGELRSLH